MNQDLKKYTPKEYLGMTGKTLYVVQILHDFGIVHKTSDNHYIPLDEVTHLQNILGIKIIKIDDTSFREMASKIYEEVYQAEFQEWVEKKELKDSEEKSDISLWCRCENREMYSGMCSICRKPLERIGG